jgi:hypothetical protein
MTVMNYAIQYETESLKAAGNKAAMNVPVGTEMVFTIFFSLTKPACEPQ